MAFVLESGCKGIAFFDTMQDFSKEKCNIYVDFNTCLHNTQPFVGAHIVLLRASVGVDKTYGTYGTNKTDRVEETDRVDICHIKHWHSYCLKEININDVAYSQINIYICR